MVVTNTNTDERCVYAYRYSVQRDNGPKQSLKFNSHPGAIDPPACHYGNPILTFETITLIPNSAK
jgi:hypothetical protein